MRGWTPTRSRTRSMGNEVARWYADTSTSPTSPEPGKASQYAIVDLNATGKGVSSVAVGVQLAGYPGWFQSDFGWGYPLVSAGHVRTVVKLPLDWSGAPGHRCAGGSRASVGRRRGNGTGPARRAVHGYCSRPCGLSRPRSSYPKTSSSLPVPRSAPPLLPPILPVCGWRSHPWGLFGSEALFVPEGLSAVEVGKGLAEHAEQDEEEREKKLNRTISIFEAALLAIVAVLAAWSGYAAAKFSTDSSLLLATSNVRTARRPTPPTSTL